MPSLGFKREFVPRIEAFLYPAFANRNGLKPKTTTIRKRRKRPFKVGDDLYLFEGLRTKKCRLIGSCICRKVEDIVIDEQHGYPVVTLDGEPVSYSKLIDMATNDGFNDVVNFVRFFRITHGLPFKGQRIHFTTTYDRKYFCNMQVKKRGFRLKLEKTAKTIEIDPDHVEAAKDDRYVRELTGAYNYGAQIMNPLLKQVEPIMK